MPYIQNQMKSDYNGMEGTQTSIPSNLHWPPLEGNLQDEHGKARKPAAVGSYNMYMGYRDKED